MSKWVFFIRRFSAYSKAKEDNDVGKEIRDGMDSIRYEGLALAE
jgi:hypothetical protein